MTVFSEAEDSPDSTPPARALRSMQTGQNSIAPENSLPQLGQVRWGSALMGLTALQAQATPCYTEWCKIGRPLANCCPVPQAIACYVILPRQIRFRKKIPGAGVLRRAMRRFEIDSHIPTVFRCRRKPCGLSGVSKIFGFFRSLRARRSAGPSIPDPRRFRQRITREMY